METKYGYKPFVIKNIIRAKLEEWFATIPHEDIRSILKEEAVVAGGAITSMLLGESPNDFDAYLQTPDAVRKVQTYYADSRKNPRQGSDATYRPILVTPNAITFSDKLQLITKYYGSPDDLQRNFDFAHTKCWYSYKDDQLHLDPQALSCIISRSLVYTSSEYPVASLFRLRKFLSRGWRVTAGQLFKIALDINRLGDLTHVPTLKEQLVGVDAMYLAAIIQACEDRDAERVDTDFLYDTINNIFEEDL